MNILFLASIFSLSSVALFSSSSVALYSSSSVALYSSSSVAISKEVKLSLQKTDSYKRLGSRASFKDWMHQELYYKMIEVEESGKTTRVPEGWHSVAFTNLNDGWFEDYF